jgi:hypothetical protein
MYVDGVDEGKYDSSESALAELQRCIFVVFPKLSLFQKLHQGCFLSGAGSQIEFPTTCFDFGGVSL